MYQSKIVPFHSITAECYSLEYSGIAFINVKANNNYFSSRRYDRAFDKTESSSPVTHWISQASSYKKSIVAQKVCRCFLNMAESFEIRVFK